MITETKEVYKCEHCRKLYQRKHFCVLHEQKCKKNSDNKQRCFDGCKYLVKKEVKYFYDAYDGQHEGKQEILFCNAKNEGVYPFWFNHPLSEEDIEDEIPNNPMPRECERFEAPK